MSELSKFMHNTAATSHRLPRNPQGTFPWQIKHNGQDGTLALQIPADNGEKPKQIGGLKSVSFIPVFAYRTVSGTDARLGSITSTPSLNPSGHLDCYAYNKGKVENLGLKSEETLKQEGHTINQRIYGFLVNVDGAKFTDDDRLKGATDSNEFGFVYMQMSMHKYYQIVAQLGLDYQTANTDMCDHLLTIVSKTQADADGNNFKITSTNDHTSWIPQVFLKGMTDAVCNRLAEKAKSVCDSIGTYSGLLEEKDKFYKKLTLHGLTSAEELTALDEAGIYDTQTLEDFLGGNESNWSELTLLANKKNAVSSFFEVKND